MLGISDLAPSHALALANTLLGIHFAVVAFNVAMPPAIVMGAWQGWQWVRARPLRLLHLGSMLVVALQAVLGDLCFLTVWESDLRTVAGQSGYEQSFIEAWLEAALYVDAPLEALVAIYLAWAALSIGLWWWVPPKTQSVKR
jgi:hypothetical protein